jgi:hypothetical protein
VALADQILAHAATLNLRDPLVVYPHGDYCLGLCREFKRRGFGLIHICMDYELAIQMEHVQKSDLTLVIPRAAFEELQAQFPEKLHMLPQLAMISDGSEASTKEWPAYAEIPKPRLGYIGNLTGRTSIPLLGKLLSNHPEWQFLSFGGEKWLPFANEHVRPWCSQLELQGVLAGLDVGLMPYDCANPYNLHCVPLKLFDYFAQGMPVVSTPIVAVREYGDLVYIGGTPEELAEATSLALKEPHDSSKRAKRMAVARSHSIENVGGYLRRIIAGRWA